MALPRPLHIELSLKFKFIAAHSLASYETPHDHLWSVRVAVSGNPHDGMVVDMAKLRECLLLTVQGLEGQYLNECEAVDAATRAFPTCESLGAFFLARVQSILERDFPHRDSSVRAAWVSVALSDLEGSEMGAARVAVRS